MPWDQMWSFWILILGLDVQQDSKHSSPIPRRRSRYQGIPKELKLPRSFLSNLKEFLRNSQRLLLSKYIVQKVNDICNKNIKGTPLPQIKELENLVKLIWFLRCYWINYYSIFRLFLRKKANVLFKSILTYCDIYGFCF